jgi:hypothetical protein
VLNAEVAARARLINAQGQELTQVNWGDGFLSQKICESVGGDSGGQQCSISKPGRIIADQLNKALGAGQDALIQADEINELISALLGQLANQALTGVAGLLGLSEGTGYTSRSSGYSGSYLDALVDESNGLAVNSGQEGEQNIIIPELERQLEYRERLVAYQTAFQDFLNQPIPELTQNNGGEGNQNFANQQARTNLLRYRQNIQGELGNITNQVTETNQDILTLVSMAYSYDQSTADQQIEILLEFTSLQLLTDYEIGIEESRLAKIANDNTVPTPALTNPTSLTNLLAAIDPSIQVDPTDESWINLAASLNITVQ